MIIVAPQRFLLGYQPAEVPRRSLIAGRSRDRQQPLSRNPAPRLGHPLTHQITHRIEIARPRLPLRRPTGLSALDTAFDRLMSGAAQLGGPTVGSDLPIGRDDVHTLPCRLQWNSLGGAVAVGAITVTAQATSSPDRHDTQGSGDFYLATNGDI